MIGKWRRLFAAVRRLVNAERRFDEIQFNQGLILSRLAGVERVSSLCDAEFKVFSQWGEDGIIQYLTRHIEIKHHTFIEFGVEDFFEANCRFLLVKDLWRGFVIDGSQKNISRLKASYFYWKYPLRGNASFITRENVEGLLEESGFDKDLGILSVDIDGVDYYVLERLEQWKARILIVEYNGVFGSKSPVSVPYAADFTRNAKHHSNLYYGASLPAFYALASSRGYALVGVNSAGSNAFFVRRELLSEAVREVSVEECFRDSCFRESRDRAGHLTFASGRKRLELIGDLPLVNVVTGSDLKVRDLHA